MKEELMTEVMQQMLPEDDDSNELIAMFIAAKRIEGFSEKLGEQIAKQLGSPKAMNRMLSYLYNVKPRSAELVVDEMI